MTLFVVVMCFAAYFVVAVPLMSWLGKRLDAADRPEPTRCNTPLSHPLDARARRNGGQL